MSKSFQMKNNYSNQSTDYDFKLGVGEFQFSDLYNPIKLKELAEKFYSDLQNQNAELHEVSTNRARHRSKS